MPIVKRVRLSDTGSASNWIGDGHNEGDDLDILGDDDLEADEGMVSDGEGDIWQDIEEGCNPSMLIDENGDVRENKRKSYASSVCFFFGVRNS